MTYALFQVSILAIPVFAILSILVYATHRQIAKRMGWPRWPTLATGIALAFILAITLTPYLGDFQRGRWCYLTIPRRWGLLELPRLTQDSLNVLLLIPLGLFAALTFRRAWLALLLIIVLPIGIEATQALLPMLGRDCTTQDMLDNITGGIIGLLIAIPVRFMLMRK